MNQIFPVLRFVRLEVKPQSILSSIDGVVFQDGIWFVLDATDKVVLRFSEEGSFLGVLGGRGQGPGEYLGPTQISRCHDNLVGVKDGTKGTILLYDTEGAFVRAFTAHHALPVYAGNVFVWDEPERLFMVDSSSRGKGSHRNAIVSFHDGEARLAGGFGTVPKTIEAMRRKGVPTFNTEGFAKVAGRLWVAPPESTTIEVYNLEGALLGQIQRAYADQITAEDIEALNPQSPGVLRAYLDLLKTKACNWQLFPVGDVVVATLKHPAGLIVEILDANGNMLRQRVQLAFPYGWPVGSFDDVIVSFLPILPGYDYTKMFSPEHRALMEKAGWKPDTAADDNPYLIVGRLAQ